MIRLYVRNAATGENNDWFNAFIESERKKDDRGQMGYGYSAIQLLDRKYTVQIDRSMPLAKSYFIEVEDMVIFWLRVQR